MALLLVAWYRYEVAGGSGRSSSGPQNPDNQELTTAGEVWSIPDTAPQVLNFTAPGSGQIWMNFTVAGGGVSIFFCPAGVVITGLPTKGCLFQAGGAEHSNGQLCGWKNGTAYSAQLTFINYGPTSGSGAVVELTWQSPLFIQDTTVHTS